MSLLPAPFLFRYSLPVQQISGIPKAKSPQLKLPTSCATPFPSLMNGGQQFASLSLAWNSAGLAISISVTGKTDWPDCQPDAPLSSDRVQIWFDTRDTQTIHRASRYCHQFTLLPMGSGKDGMQPVLQQFPVPRAGDDAPEVELDSILLESETTESDYCVSAWFPTHSLHGFDPEVYSRLGFYLMVHDGELGQQFLTVGEDFPYQSDPSLWVSLDLCAAAP